MSKGRNMSINPEIENNVVKPKINHPPAIWGSV
jgi:hypothetical protein